MSDTTDTAPDTARAEAKAKREGIIEGMISMGESFSEHLDATTREIEGILDDLREVAGWGPDAGETKAPGDEPDAEPESVCDGDVRTEGIWRDDVEIDPEMAKVIEAVERDNPGKTSHLGSGKGEGDPIDFDSDPALSEMAEATRRADDEAARAQVAEVPVDADEARTASALRLGHSLGMWGAIPIQKVRGGEVLPDVLRDEHLFRVENTILLNFMGEAKGAGYEVEIYKPGKFTSDVRVHRPATSSRVNHKNACPECGSLAIATRITDLTIGGSMRVCYDCDHIWPRF